MSIEFKKQTLSNGLTIIAECNDEAHTSAVGYFVKTGARDEERPIMGVSHFLEHMMFKGTLRGRTGEDVNREFDEIGANYNAFTSHEMTVFYAHVLPEYLPRAIDLLGDMLRPALRDSDFDMEKNVILEEIGMYEDRPQWRLQDTLLEHFYNQHPLSFRVLGTSDTIKALRVEQMRDYFGQRYGADHITVAAAGRIDFDTLVGDVEKLAGDWPRAQATRSYDPPSVSYSQKAVADAKLNRHYVAAICPAPSAQDPRRYAAMILTDVLGDADGSRLYWALIDPGLADEASFMFEPQDHTGAYVAFASCDPERAAEVEAKLLETIDVYAQNIDTGEIDRAKHKIATNITVHGERPLGRMNNLGGTWAYLAQYTPLEIELERIMAVTPDNVRQLIQDLPLNPRTIVRLGPK
ncbi:MAG: pitrilysin family protein [Phycisphaeraceae bacterium]